MNDARKSTRSVKDRIVLGCVIVVIALMGIGWKIYERYYAFRRGHFHRSCWENLTRIHGAKEQWALDFGQPAGARPTAEDLAPSDGSGYMKNFPGCWAGEYVIGPIGEPPRCDSGKPDHTFEAMMRYVAERDGKVGRPEAPIGAPAIEGGP